MADFELPEAEFSRQAAVLGSLASIIDVNAGRTANIVVDGRPLPFVPNGGQNTMAAAAVVLLAAHFEEYIRQQIEEYARAIIVNYRNFDDDFKLKFIDAYWRSGLGRLQRFRPKFGIQWAGHARPIIKGLEEFPIDDLEASFIASLICEHDNNMRFETILELCGRVGIKKLGEKLGRSNPLKGALGVTRQADVAEATRTKLSEFYDLRNRMVHSIAQNAGVGLTIFEGWKNFLLLMASAFKGAMELALAEFESGLPLAPAPMLAPIPAGAAP